MCGVVIKFCGSNTISHHTTPHHAIPPHPTLTLFSIEKIDSNSITTFSSSPTFFPNHLYIKNINMFAIKRSTFLKRSNSNFYRFVYIFIIIQYLILSFKTYSRSSFATSKSKSHTRPVL